MWHLIRNAKLTSFFRNVFKCFVQSFYFFRGNPDSLAVYIQFVYTLAHPTLSFVEVRFCDKRHWYNSLFSPVPDLLSLAVLRFWVCVALSIKVYSSPSGSADLCHWCPAKPFGVRSTQKSFGEMQNSELLNLLNHSTEKNLKSKLSKGLRTLWGWGNQQINWRGLYPRILTEERVASVTVLLTSGISLSVISVATLTLVALGILMFSKFTPWLMT